MLYARLSSLCRCSDGFILLVSAFSALTRRAARDADAVSPDYGVEETKAHKQQHDDLLPGLDQYVALDEGSRTDSTEPSGFPFSPEVRLQTRLAVVTSTNSFSSSSLCSL